MEVQEKTNKQTKTRLASIAGLLHAVHADLVDRFLTSYSGVQNQLVLTTQTYYAAILEAAFNNIFRKGIAYLFYEHLRAKKCYFSIVEMNICF